MTADGTNKLVNFTKKVVIIIISQSAEIFQVLWAPSV